MTDADPEQLSIPRIEQLETGVAGLDRLLQGGLRRTGLHVVLGRAGAGKSILAHQAGAHHIRQGGTVLYLTALVETHQTLISQARTFPFFDPATVAHGFYYASLSPALERGGLQAMAEEIGRLVHERAPSLLIIDGLHALRLGAASRLDYQRWLHTLEAQAAMTGMTTVLLTHPRRGSSNDPTFTIADGIIEMRTVQEQLRSVRLLSVRKLRGVGHIGGWHLAEITSGGLHVYPRLEALVAAEGVPANVPPLTNHEFLAKGLTEMMGGGVPSSSTSFIIGTPGSGKTFLGLAFLCGVRKTKEKALHYGFHETPDRLLQKADAVGLPLRQLVDDGQVQLQWQPPAELVSDEIAARILRIVDEQGIKRLVLDAYNQFALGAAVGGRSAEFFGAFCTLLRARGVAIVLTQDMTRIAGTTFDLPVGDVSQMVDNIIHVRSTEIHAQFRRLIAVLKVREQSYDRAIRELSIDTKGIRVGDVFTEGESLLTGLPTFGESGRPGKAVVSETTPDPEAAVPASGPRPQILVADDEDGTLSLMQTALVYAGFTVLTARDGSEAMLRARESPPDLALLDVMMPGMDGREVCRRMAADPALAHVPVILHSSADESDIDWRGCHADAFLQKPFNVRELPGLVRRNLSARSGAGRPPVHSLTDDEVRAIARQIWSAVRQAPDPNPRDGVLSPFRELSADDESRVEAALVELLASGGAPRRDRDQQA